MCEKKSTLNVKIALKIAAIQTDWVYCAKSLNQKYFYQCQKIIAECKNTLKNQNSEKKIASRIRNILYYIYYIYLLYHIEHKIYYIELKKLNHIFFTNVKKSPRYLK